MCSRPRRLLRKYKLLELCHLSRACRVHRKLCPGLYFEPTLREMRHVQKWHERALAVANSHRSRRVWLQERHDRIMIRPLEIASLHFGMSSTSTPKLMNSKPECSILSEFEVCTQVAWVNKCRQIRIRSLIDHVRRQMYDLIASRALNESSVEVECARDKDYCEHLIVGFHWEIYFKIPTFWALEIPRINHARFTLSIFRIRIWIVSTSLPLIDGLVLLKS